MTSESKSMGDMPSDEVALAQLSTAVAGIRSQVARVIVGQQDVIEQLLVAMLAGGHCLLVGVPGLAKTLMIGSELNAIELERDRLR